MTGFLMGADGNVYSYNQTALGLYCVSNTNPSIVCTKTRRFSVLQAYSIHREEEVMDGMW